MKHICFLALLAVLYMPLVALGQGQPAAGREKAKPAATTKSKAGASAMSMKVAPSPEIRKLAKSLVGTWTTEESAPPSEMMPNGGTGSGVAVIHRGPGGHSLVQSYHSQSAMGKFAGHGITWYDTQAKAYKNIWCDTMTPNGCDVFNGSGKWEGDKLVFSGTQDMMGKTAQVRETISDITPDSFTFTIDSGPDENSMKNFMTIKYTRKAGGMKARKGSAENPPAKP